MARPPRPSDSDIVIALDAIRRIVRVLRDSSRDAERELGVSGAQLFVLRKLGDGEKHSVSDLASRTATHQSSVSVVVQRLVAGGMVASRSAPDDRRRRELSLTARGRALLARAPEAAQDELIAGLRRMPAADGRRLAQLLVALVESMGASGEPASMFFEDGAKNARKNRVRK